MKKSLVIFAAIVMMAGFTSRVMAQAVTDTKSNSANAQILSAISLTTVDALEFGGIIPNTALGTVVIDNTSGRTRTGGVTLVTSAITPKSGTYTVTGGINTSYIITIPTASFDITNGTDLMAVTDMTCSKGAVTAGSVGSVFSATGTDSFSVGGTLNVAAAQPLGAYTGTFNVTVAY